ncbi:MAG: glycosyltransferase, partial [bacterium]|nr:glycosyltransferase [bacterium]
MVVSISLLTYNGSRFIENCLKSVLAQTHSKIELLIIDNASQDKTVAEAQDIISKENPKFPVRVIQNGKNLGFSGGHNLGIRESRGELILFLNQDVVLAPDFVEKAVDFFQKNKDEKIGVLQPKLLRLDKEMHPSDVIDTVGLAMLKNRRIISRGQGGKDVGQFNKEEEVFGADGA